MTDEKLEPIDPELRRLLDAERAPPPPLASSLDRLWSRVAMTSLPGPGGGGTSGMSSGARPGAGWLASHVVGVAGATFVMGAIAGAGVYAGIQKQPPERIVYVEREARLTAPVVSLPLALSSAPPAMPSTEASPPTRAHSPAASVPPASSLVAERALLDDARGALGSGDAARALALADDHVRRFPRAQLGEEREAIAIQALVALGRYDEARGRAARFRSSTPNSLFLPAIDASLQSIP